MRGRDETGGCPSLFLVFVFAMTGSMLGINVLCDVCVFLSASCSQDEGPYLVQA